MKGFKIFILCIAVLILLGTLTMGEEQKKCIYPETPKKPVVDNYFGTEIADPYRWLEDFDNPEVQQWIEKQNELSRSLLDTPLKEKILKRLAELMNYPRQGTFIKRGDYYYFFANTGLQNQDILYRRKGLEGKDELVIDPLALGIDETAAMNWQYISDDGKYIAYGISTKGDEQATLFIRDVASSKNLTEAIPGCRYTSVGWLKNNTGFYYTRFPDPKTVEKGKEGFNQKVYFHKVGDDYKSDQLIYENPAVSEMLFGCDLSDDDNYLGIVAYIGTKPENEVYLYDTREKSLKKIFAGFDASYNVELYNDWLFILTNKEAPNYKLVKTLLSKPEPVNWQTLIPEKEFPIQNFTIIGGKLFVLYLENAFSTLYVYDLDGKLIKKIETPVPGTIRGVIGKHNHQEAFFGFTSFAYPPTIYRIDTTNLKIDELYRTPVKADVDNYTAEQVWYNSKDGTKVPMFLVHKKGAQKDGKNPVVLTGYGGFNIPMVPMFNVSYYIFLEKGGMYAIPNLRGGGEFGTKWHEAGMLANKQNVYDDFIAAAEYLIKEKWTSKDKLAIYGGSNGGLLTGAAVTQRPDLFKAVVSMVPLLDMLRYHRFSIGKYWVSEYGSSDNSEQFKYLKAYSPYHHIKKDINFPAIYLTAGASDARVAPLHAMKFTAMIQNDTKTTNPVLLKVEYKAGHGQGKPLMRQLESIADLLTFIFWQLGVEM